MTGASRGIGAAIAKRLAADGAFVVVNDRDPNEAADAVVAAIREAGGEAEPVFADVADPRRSRRCSGPSSRSTVGWTCS